MAIRWDKFTVKSQQAMQQAQNRATELGNPEIQPVHLLLALIEDREGVIPAVLRDRISATSARLVYLTPRGATVLAEAHRQAIAIEERMMSGLTQAERRKLRTWLANAAAALNPMP